MDWAKIVSEFKDGVSIVKLSEKYDLPYGRINNYLIKNGFKKTKRNKLTSEQINRVIQLIKNNVSMNKIVQETKMDKSTIRQIAFENNLTITRAKQERSMKNGYFVDNYFETIDTEEKAYFLGLIYTDGNVREHNGGYYLNLELLREDKYILEKLADELKCENKIYDRNRNTQFGENITSSFTSCNSQKLFEDLAIFNIIPNKSHTTKCFNNIDEKIPRHLIRHFLRGLVDGDGTISKRYTTTQNTIAVYQNEIEFCNEFDRLLKKSLNDNTLFDNIVVNKNSGVYNLRYRRIYDVQKICNHLYHGSTIYLNRKYELAKLYFENYKQKESAA